MDKIGPISEVRANLPKLLDRVQKTQQRFIITRQGKAVAIVISPEDLETLEILADRDLIKSLIRAEVDIKTGRFYTSKEVFGA